MFVENIKTLFFSSSGPKDLMSYSRAAASVVRPSVVRPSVRRPSVRPFTFSKHYSSFTIQWIPLVLTDNSPWGGGSTGMVYGGTTCIGYGTSGAKHKNTKNATPPTNHDRFSNRWCQIVALSRAHPGMSLLVVNPYFANLVEYRILKISNFLTF